MEYDTVAGPELAQMLATRLRAEARRRHVSSEQMAELIGVNPVTYSRWVNGHARPDDHNLRRIAAVLRVPVDTLKRELVTSRVTSPTMLAAAPDTESSVIRDAQALLWSFERLSPESREAVIDFAQRLRQEELQAPALPSPAEEAPVDAAPKEVDRD